MNDANKNQSDLYKEIKEITKKRLYNNIMNFTLLKVGTTFMNSENSKTSDPLALIINLKDEKI